ncbi:hypothetical protein SAMN02745123_00651 [Desulforamulus aeronauticus DSM 10349]|uniref:Uncharacterized protein n=1 Tax=Desulforamulus aeronauticus DSM 10349 TaxID=1121421 RepID=A0A1M6PLC3_9FIRM|nr:hypothetical protein SAMN02745123_00651 [Desulforamulus aeronauticus DSM 10349]
MLKRESDFSQGNVDLTSIRKQEIVEGHPPVSTGSTNFGYGHGKAGFLLRFAAENISLIEMFFLFLLFKVVLRIVLYHYS